MKRYKDVFGRNVRLTDERYRHFTIDHPEMTGQDAKLRMCLSEPDVVIQSKSDSQVELFYRNYKTTPVTEKYMCAVVKVNDEPDAFIITAYFTDTVKKGDLLWKKK